MIDLTIARTYCIFTITLDSQSGVLVPIRQWVLSTRKVRIAIKTYNQQPRGQGRIGIHLDNDSHHWLTHADIQRMDDYLHQHSQTLIKELNRHVQSSSHLRRR